MMPEISLEALRDRLAREHRRFSPGFMELKEYRRRECVRSSVRTPYSDKTSRARENGIAISLKMVDALFHLVYVVRINT